MAITQHESGPVYPRPLLRQVQSRLLRPRGSWLMAVRCRLHRRAIDRELAAGYDPELCECRHRRAAELTGESSRLALATAYERLLACVLDPQAYRLLPVEWGGVRAARPRIEALSSRLRGDSQVSARGVACARLLLMERDSALYRKQDASVLAHQIRSTLSLL